MKEKEKEVSANGNKVVWKGPKRIVVLIIGFIAILLLGMQVYASTNGYGNVFFMIKELITTGTLEGENEIFSDKEITLSYKSIDIAEGVKLQANKLEIRENESTLCLHITATEENKVLPLTYEWMSEGLNKTEVKGSKNAKGDFDERLTVKYAFVDDELMTLYVKDKDGNLLRELEINLGTHEIYVKGENEAEKISQIELKKYLSTFSRLNNNSEKRNQLVQIAYDIHEIAAPGIQDAPEISKMNEAIKEFYGDKVEFVKDTNKAGKEIEIFKVDGEKPAVSDKMDIYTNDEDLDNTQKGICLKIEDIKYENEVYTVKYIYTLATEIDEADGKIEELPQYEATIKLKVNKDAKYSKYQVVELSKGTEIKEKVSTDANEELDKTDEGNYVREYIMKTSDVLKTESHGDYYTYIDNFDNKYNIKKIESVDIEFCSKSNDGKSHLYKATVNYLDNNDKKASFELAVAKYENQDELGILGTFDNYTGTTRFVKEYTDLYDDGTASCDHTYEVVRNSGTKGPDGSHTTLDGTHIERCTKCGEQRVQPHNFGKWFELKNSSGEIYAYTLWCNDCKDYIYTNDYSVVQNSGYEMNEETKHSHNYVVVQNSGTKVSDTDHHTTLDGTHICKCSECGEEKQEPHNFGEWFDIGHGSYTLWCKDCKDYVYTNDYSVVQNSGYGMHKTEQHSHNYNVIRNSGTKAEDGTHTTLDGTHTVKCSECGEEKQEPHNFGKWFDIGHGSYTLWCEDCKDYVYTNDYSVVENSGYGINGK